jgi:hypothetical protein
MTEAEKFRTERLVARSWQIEDLLLAMELWGDPAVTALIDSRGKLTNAQVGEKLRAEIERERSGGVQYWALFDHRNGEFVGCGGLRPWLYTPGEANFEVGFHLVKRCWGKGFATEAAFGALEYAWEKLRLSPSLRWASPPQSCFGENLEKARIRVHRKCVLRANRLNASVLRLQSAAPETERFHIALARNSS